MKKKTVRNLEGGAGRRNTEEPLKLLIAIAPFIAGLYYEWTSICTSGFLLIYLWYCFRNTGRIILTASLTLLTAFVIPFSYGLSVLWAVDSGMTLFGVIKYLPVFLFVAASAQLESVQKRGLTDYLPLSGAAMTVISFGLSQISMLREYFIVNSRQAGFFQYPNTYSLFLLTGIIVILWRAEWKRESLPDLFLLLILIAGVILTGSRTGFLLLVFTGVCFFFASGDKRIRAVFAALLGGAGGIAVVYVLATGNLSSAGRFLTISLSSSTFLGRLLYFKDAWPAILRHPLGLGYMGYYYTQGSFQTGVYSVVNVHNDLLQILLDIGWIPAVVFLLAAGNGILRGSGRNRMILIVILLHSMMDFHLQFGAICLILFTVMDTGEKPDMLSGKQIETKKPAILAAGTVLTAGMVLWLGTASAFYYGHKYEEAVGVYPGYTEAWMEVLKKAEDVDSMEETADKILEQNPQNPLAMNAKARVAYSQGDFGTMISYKQQALEYYRYHLAEYLDYFDMLYVGYQLYMEYDDTASAQVCAECMLEIPDMLAQVLEDTDPLAYKIHDQPELELPEEYEAILLSLQKAS